MTNAARAVGAQQGAMVLVSVLLMLVLMTLATLYSARLVQFRLKATDHDQRHLKVKSSAQAALNEALAYLNANPGWSGAPLLNAEQTEFSGQWQTNIREKQSVSLIALSAKAELQGAMARASVQENAIRYRLLANKPVATLMVKGQVIAQGSIQLVANPNGLGQGVPLSYWGDQTLITDSLISCGRHEYQHELCSTEFYSDHNNKGLDIADNASSFPTDILGYLFNVSEADWPLLRDEADWQLNVCNQAVNNAWGLIWVDGDCHIPADSILGSLSEPVILIVADGDLSLASQVRVYGLVVLFGTPAQLAKFELSSALTSSIHGAMAASQGFKQDMSTLNVIYDDAVLDALATQPLFKRIARVPGSWRDF